MRNEWMKHEFNWIKKEQSEREPWSRYREKRTEWAVRLVVEEGKRKERKNTTQRNEMKRGVVFLFLLFPSWVTNETSDEFVFFVSSYSIEFVLSFFTSLQFNWIKRRNKRHKFFSLFHLFYLLINNLLCCVPFFLIELKHALHSLSLVFNSIKRNTAQELLLEDYEGSEVKEVNEMNKRR